jgi:hypothetical protein
MWEPKVEHRDHPMGDAGVNLSLERVAEKVSSGRKDPKLQKWAIDVLYFARDKGQNVKTPRGRAVALLAAVQKKIWVPDPVGVERMFGAHLLACDPDKPSKDGAVCLRGGDCDDLSSVLGAAFLSVGIPTVIVGHGYDDEGHIEHVLMAGYVDRRWQYADPSTDLQLGKCVPFSRERVLSVPKIGVVCDDKSCIADGLGGVHPDRFIERGEFMSVDGPPTSFAGLASRVVWSGLVSCRI